MDAPGLGEAPGKTPAQRFFLTAEPSAAPEIKTAWKKSVTVQDKMQRNCRYELTAPICSDFDPEFTPELTPKQMLELGVFGGK